MKRALTPLLPSHQGYAVDPLHCPQCGHTLRRLAVSDGPAVIRRLLKPRRRWDPQPKAPDPPVATRPGPRNPRSHSLTLPFPTAPALWADHRARAARRTGLSSPEHPARHPSSAARPRASRPLRRQRLPPGNPTIVENLPEPGNNSVPRRIDFPILHVRRFSIDSMSCILLLVSFLHSFFFAVFFFTVGWRPFTSAREDNP